MQKIVERIVAVTKHIFLPLGSILLGIIILKQINLYDAVVNLYEALLPLFGGFVIAFLLQPIIDRIAKRCSLKTAVILVYAGILVLGGLLFAFLIPILYQQIVDFAKVLPEWIVKIETFLSKHHIVLENLGDYKQQFLEEGYTIVVDSLKTFVSGITKYGIAYITAFFISIDMEFWKRSAKKIVSNYHKIATFYKTMSNIVFQYLVGTALDLTFIAITSGVILYAAKFPNAILYAVLLALSNLFPYIGPSVGLVLVLFVGILSYEQLPVITFVLIWVIQQIEANFIQPMIFNKTMDVRPILTFVALFVCEALFGIPGVLLSPIFASIMQIAFRSYLHAKTSDQVGEWEDIWYDFDEVMDNVDTR